MSIFIIFMSMIILLSIFLVAFNILDKNNKIKDPNKNQNIQSHQNRINLIGIIIRCFSYVILVLGIIPSINVLLSKNSDNIIAIYILIIDIITFMFFMGLSEIIILLDKMNKK